MKNGKDKHHGWWSIAKSMRQWLTHDKKVEQRIDDLEGHIRESKASLIRASRRTDVLTNLIERMQQDNHG